MRNLFAFIMVVVASSVVLAEEKTVDNPAYPTWSKQKVGTTITQKNTTEASGTKTESTTTYKLLEVTAEKVVVEMTSKTVVMGMEFGGPPTKMDIAKSTKVTVDPKAQAEADKLKASYTTTTGEETLKIGGKEYKCKWSKVKGTIAGNEYEATTWTSDDVPNQIVKMVSKNKGAMVDATTTIQTTEIKTP